MRFASVCSGIEAASAAWLPLGWTSQFFAEIEPFPCAVLAHHYGTTPNFGDITRFMDWPDAAFDLLTGGTPCQSFSVAGLRKGLADPRGNLALVYLAIADRYRPEWLVWENVPGVLSSNEGRDFGAFLGGLGQLGYGFAYRVLDAQFVRVDGFERAVPQRRRRVFVVGNSRSWRRAAAVLFEPESLCWDSAPRREAGQGIARPIAAGSRRGSGYRNDADTAENLICGTLNANGKAAGSATQQDAESGMLIAFGGNDTSGPINIATARNAHGGPHGRPDFESETFVCAPIARTLTRGAESAGKGGYAGRRQEDDDNLIAFDLRNGTQDAVSMSLQAGGMGDERGLCPNGLPHTLTDWRVRRLTPTECERLMGFPDGYTAIPFRRKPAADGPRYKALGNSQAVNVIRWLGRRIEMVAALAREAA